MTEENWKWLGVACVTAAAIIVFQWPVIFLMSLFCFGAFKGIDSMLWKLFEMDRYDIEIRLPKWVRFILSPVLFCIYCSASFWGTTAYLLAFWAGIHPEIGPIEWVLFVVATTGLNSILNEFVRL